MQRLRAAEFRPRRKTLERFEKKTAKLLKDWGVNSKWEKADVRHVSHHMAHHNASWGSISKLHSYS